MSCSFSFLSECLFLLSIPNAALFLIFAGRSRKLFGRSLGPSTTVVAHFFNPALTPEGVFATKVCGCYNLYLLIFSHFSKFFISMPPHL